MVVIAPATLLGKQAMIEVPRYFGAQVWRFKFLIFTFCAHSRPASPRPRIIKMIRKLTLKKYNIVVQCERQSFKNRSIEKKRASVLAGKLLRTFFFKNELRLVTSLS